MDDDALRDIEKGHSGSAVIEEGEVALSMKVSLFLWRQNPCLV